MKHRRKPSPTRTAPQAAPVAKTVRRSYMVLAGVLVAFLAARLLGALPGIPSPWGTRINLVLPGLWDALLLVPAIFLLLPGVSEFVTSRLGSAQVSRRRLVVSSLILILGIGFLSWNFPVAFAFLGDGALYVGEVYRAGAIEGYSGMLIKPTAWLTGWLLNGLATILHPENARLPFMVLSVCSLVVVFVGGFWALRDETPRDLILLGSLLLGSAGTVFFFGYLELYALGYAFSILHFSFLWRAIKAGESLVPTTILLILAVASSAVAVVFLPGLLTALALRRGWGTRLFRHPLFLIIGMGVILLLLAMINPFPGNGVLIPLHPFEHWDMGRNFGWQKYTLFSSTHLADLPNSYFLCSGLAGFLILVLPWLSRDTDTENPPLTVVLTMAAGGGILFLIFGNTYLGQARDWDVLALSLLPLPFAATAMLLRLGEERHRLLNRLFLPVVITALVSGASWVMVNLSESASVQWFERVLKRYDGVILNVDMYTGYDNLEKFYASGGSDEDRLRVLWLMEQGGHQRVTTWRKLLQTVMDGAAKGEWVSGNRNYTRLLDRVVEEARRKSGLSLSCAVSEQDLREFLVRALAVGLTLGADSQVRNAVTRAEAAVRLNPWPEKRVLEALLDSSRSVLQRPEHAASGISEGTRDPYLLMIVGELYQKSGDPTRAASWMERALKLAPREYPSWYLVLAGVYHRDLKDDLRAGATLEQCLVNCPRTKEAEKAAIVLGRMK